MSTNLQHGTVEGVICARDGCEGVLHIPPVENCSCHINPPCAACTDNLLACPECGWEEERISYAHFGGGMAIGQPYKRRPLDPTKIDYRIEAHTNSSQICSGVYPEGTTRKDVEAKVRGTFGGRFERFGDGKFKYIAYTD